MSARIAALAAAAILAAALASCAPRALRFDLAADPSLMPELERLIAEESLPAGWSRAEPGIAAEATIELAAGGRAGAGRAGLDADAGSRFLAAAVPIDDLRYSVSADAARAIGLEPLAGVFPPRRALAVDGAWPGEPGYPFVERLTLSARRAARPGAAFPRGSPIAGWLERAAARAAASRAVPLRLAAGGDFQAKGRESRLVGPGGVEALLGAEIVGRMRAADIAVLNFEGVASARGEPNPRKRFRFRMPPGSGKALAAAGVDAVLLANNHVLDFGPEAFLDTLSEMKAAGLSAPGAGMDLAEASAPAALPPGAGIRLIGFAAYPLESLGFRTSDAAAGPSRPGINADEAVTIAAIKAARAAGGAAVVLAHGGAEYLARPSAEVISRYARFADAGAALVLGGHPHVLQGIASRGRSLIAYSLGNFLFTGLEEPELSVRSALLEFLLLDGEPRGFRIHPVIVGVDRTEADPDARGAEARFSRLCAAVKGE